jgi:glutamate racemase
MTTSELKTAGPIGVFDSGVGGLTVLRSIREAFPFEDLIYLGDTARVPYGNKGAETVRRYAVNVARFLVDRGCRALVIACNTASAQALDAVMQSVDVPVVDVIRPVAQYIGEGTAQTVLVLGTRGTVGSGAYPREIARTGRTLTVVQQPCPLLVPLAEEGWLQGDVPSQVVRRYLQPVLSGLAVDTIVLGCTHYPLLRDVIAHEAAAICGYTPAILDGGFHASRVLGGLPTMQQRPERGPGQTHFCVTDDPSGFIRVASLFLGHDVESAEHVDIT